MLNSGSVYKHWNENSKMYPPQQSLGDTTSNIVMCRVSTTWIVTYRLMSKNVLMSVAWHVTIWMAFAA